MPCPYSFENKQKIVQVVGGGGGEKQTGRPTDGRTQTGVITKPVCPSLETFIVPSFRQTRGGGEGGRGGVRGCVCVQTRLCICVICVCVRVRACAREEKGWEREGRRERGGGGIASFHSRSVYRSQNIPETPKHLRVQWVMADTVNETNSCTRMFTPHLPHPHPHPVYDRKLEVAGRVWSCWVAPEIELLVEPRSIGSLCALCYAVRCYRQVERESQTLTCMPACLPACLPAALSLSLSCADPDCGTRPLWKLNNVAVETVKFPQHALIFTRLDVSRETMTLPLRKRRVIVQEIMKVEGAIEKKDFCCCCNDHFVFYF